MERRGRDLVSSSTCSLRSSRATRWLMCCEPLSAWSPLTSKGNASISASARDRETLESASTAATNSYCVTSSTRSTSSPLLAVELSLVTESPARSLDAPVGAALRRSPILTWVGFGFVMGLRRRRSLGQWRRRDKWRVHDGFSPVGLARTGVLPAVDTGGDHGKTHGYEHPRQPGRGCGQRPALGGAGNDTLIGAEGGDISTAAPTTTALKRAVAATGSPGVAATTP